MTPARLLDSFAVFADRPYLVDAAAGQAHTYAAVNGLSKSLAAAFAARGLTPGSTVAVFSENSVLYAAVYLACLRSGWVAVPINTTLSAGDIEYILGASGASLLVASAGAEPAIRGLAAKSGIPVFLLPTVAKTPPGPPLPRGGEELAWAVPENPERLAEPFPAIADDAVWAVTFTSGTTGKPKGVPHTSGSLGRAAASFAHAYGFGPHTRLLHVSNMAYMAGFLNTLLCPLAAGACVVVAQPFTGQTALQFWGVPIKYQVNTFWLVPSILTALLKLDRNAQAPAYCREHVERVCVGTAPLARQVQLDFEAKYGVEVFESYGLSETLFVAANSPAFPRKPASAGRVLPGVEVRVADDGELLVRSAFQMAGYWDPDRHVPDAATAEGWFPSGDLGHVDGDGDLFITGRKKDLVIRGGFNISPRAVEEVLLEHPGVRDAAVVGVPHPFYGEDLLCYLELKPGVALPAILPELRALGQAKLAAGSAPTQFVALDALPRNSTGKVLKTELRTLTAEKP